MFRLVFFNSFFFMKGVRGFGLVILVFVRRLVYGFKSLLLILFIILLRLSLVNVLINDFWKFVLMLNIFLIILVMVF